MEFERIENANLEEPIIGRIIRLFNGYRLVALDQALLLVRNVRNGNNFIQLT